MDVALTKRGDSINTDSTIDVEYWWESLDPPIGPTKLIDSQCLTAVNRQSFTGWDIPHFHRRRKKGELLPQTPWRQFRQTGSYSGTYDFTYTVSGDRKRVWWTSMPDTTTWPVASDETIMSYVNPTDKFVQEAAAKIYSTGWDALTFIAELSEVHRLFMSAGKKLLAMNLPSNWKKLSNEYLSIRYGWRTLLYDMKNIIEMVDTINEKRTRYSERLGTKVSTSDYWMNDTEHTHFKTHAEICSEVVVSYRGSVVADIEVPKIQFNPIQTAWEIIPLSFVVDWFISVGKSLSALSFLAYNSKYSASHGFRAEVIQDWTYYAFDFEDTFVSGTVEQSSYCKSVLEVRTPCKVPLLPHLRLNLNPMKILDLLGLLIQRT